MSGGPETARAGPRPVRALVVALGAGVALGLFLGERARVFDLAAQGFVRLLQMAVLPYVTVSIVAGIGALRGDELRTLSAKAALVLLGLWVVALAVAFLMPLTFPQQERAAFFSTTLVEAPPQVDFLELYIPANPFHALANSIVPAVVLFSFVVGVALIGLPRKQVLLDVLEAAEDTLGRVMRFVARLTPYGAFAIAATTAGTLRPDQLARLEIYLVVYAALAAVLALWILPGLVAALTPIPARAIFAATREALLTATVAGDLFIVLPALIASCRDLIAAHGGAARQAQAMPDVIVPVSYNFPHSGKLLSVSFVLFAGWFSDSTVSPAEYPRLAVTGVVTLFGSVMAGIPFLLDLFRVPADTMQLFVASSVINSRMGTLVAAMHTVAVALLGTCAVAGLVRWRAAVLARYLAVTTVLLAAVVGGGRLVAADVVARSHPDRNALDTMRVSRVGEAVVRAAVLPVEPAGPAGTRLAAIAARRILRVCVLPDALPFAFVNGGGDLVGFDVALMHDLAVELKVRLEFLPLDSRSMGGPAGIPALLQRGACDLVIGGLAVTPARTALMQLSSSYLDETLGFVVLDRDRRRFTTWDAIRAAGPLTIAVPDLPYFLDALRVRLPAARLRPVRTLAEMVGPDAPPADALAMPAERGSAWTLRYPRYSVVVPARSIKVPLAVALPRGEPDLAGFIDTWLDLKRKDGTLDALYDYWILGRDPAAQAPRWSIIRDVLHWVDEGAAARE